MPLLIACPWCQNSVSMPEHLSGHSVPCPVCGGGMQVPYAQTPMLPVAAPAPSYISTPYAADRPAASTARLQARRPRTWQFWVCVAAGVVAGFWFLEAMFWIVVPAWQNANSKVKESEKQSKVETLLSRHGYVTDECLVCRERRLPEAKERYSDEHGFGLCHRCGHGQQASKRIENNSGSGSPDDQRAARQFMQTVQQNLTSDPNEFRNLMLIGVLSSFGTPGWDSLYGPVDQASATTK